jgi:putative ABC transport system permease protein
MLVVKLRRDLRGNWTRFALMAVAIAVSLTVCGAVLYAWSAVGRETRSAYLGTEPASATILLDEPLTAQAMAEIVQATEARAGVIEATGRTQVESSIKVNGEARDNPVQVFAAPAGDPMDMARFQVEGGEWAPAQDEIFIGSDSLDLLDVSVGDTVSLRQTAGGPLTLRVAGTVYDPSLAPSGQEQRGHAYVPAETLLASVDQPLLNQLKVQLADPGATTASLDRDLITAEAARLGAWLEDEYGVKLREIQVPEPGAHPHQFQADVLLLSLLGGGFAALLLSTILVATMLNTLFARQIPQIGILKAIGARSRSIGGMYLAMILVVAAASTLLSLGPGAWLGRALADQILSMLGVQPESLNPDWWSYVAVMALGLLLPPIMTLLPLVRASRTTVRAAIDHHGGSARPSAATRVLAKLGWLGRANRTLLLALRNTVRRPARLLLSVGLLAGAGIVFVTAISIGDGMSAVAEEQEQARVWDVEIQLARPADPTEAAAAVSRLPGVTDVEGLTVATTSLASRGSVPVTRTYPDQGHGRVSVFAIPPERSMFVAPDLVAGRWPQPDETGAVVLSVSARDDNVPATNVGDDVELSIEGKATTWEVVGLADDQSGSTYTTAAGFASALDQPSQVNLLRIITDEHDEGTRSAVAVEAEEALQDAGLTVKDAASVSRANESSQGHVGPLVTIMLAIAIAMGIVGGIGLASTMGANVLDRTREFGVMHAIGAQPRIVRRSVVAEGLLIGLVSCLVALPPALGFIALLGNGLGNVMMDGPIPYRVSVLAMAIWVAISTIGAALATDAAATRASRVTVREALAYL